MAPSAIWSNPSSPPSQLQIQPSSKISFNAPFNEEQSSRVTLTAHPSFRIVWKMRHISVGGGSKHIQPKPSWGVIESGKTAVVTVNCKPFTSSKTNDQLSIEWFTIWHYGNRQNFEQYREISEVNHPYHDYLSIEYNR